MAAAALDLQSLVAVLKVIVRQEAILTLTQGQTRAKDSGDPLLRDHNPCAVFEFDCASRTTQKVVTHQEGIVCVFEVHSAPGGPGEIVTGEVVGEQLMALTAKSQHGGTAMARTVAHEEIAGGSAQDEKPRRVQALLAVGNILAAGDEVAAVAAQRIVLAAVKGQTPARQIREVIILEGAIVGALGHQSILARSYPAVLDPHPRGVSDKNASAQVVEPGVIRVGELEALRVRGSQCRVAEGAGVAPTHLKPFDHDVARVLYQKPHPITRQLAAQDAHAFTVAQHNAEAKGSVAPRAAGRAAQVQTPEIQAHAGEPLQENRRRRSSASAGRCVTLARFQARVALNHERSLGRPERSDRRLGRVPIQAEFERGLLGKSAADAERQNEKSARKMVHGSQWSAKKRAQNETERAHQGVF